jgi:hypothetical protein
MISQNSRGPSSQDFAITGLPDGKEKLAARRIPQGSAALTSCGEATALVAFAGLEIQAAVGTSLLVIALNSAAGLFS